MLEAIIAILGMLATALPAIIHEMQQAKERKEQESDALITRDRDVLHDALHPGGVQPKT